MRGKTGYILCGPAIAVLGVLVVLPLANGVWQAFTDANLLRPTVRTVGLANFVAMARDPVFWVALRHSLVLTTVVVLLQLVLGTILALALKQNVRGVSVFRSLAMTTWVIPVVATVVMFKFMTQTGYGFFNILLEKVGLGQYATYWFGDIRWAFALVVFLHLWRNVPFYGVALLAAMQSIPKDLYEAAQIDGADAWQQFRHITVPGIKYMAMVMVTIHVIWTFNNFDLIYLATGGGPVDVTEVLPVYLYKQCWHNFSLGYGAALGVVMLTILTTFFLLYTRMSGEREV
ncbi:MAG: carbohydrate ABC transporter permease [Betaproteobacteria bacterium]